MKAEVKEEEWRDVNISQFHADDVTKPVVEYRIVRPARDSADRIYEVRLRWYDRNEDLDRRLGEPTLFSGSYRDCHKWLRSQGVQTDDHRF